MVNINGRNVIVSCIDMMKLEFTEELVRRRGRSRLWIDMGVEVFRETVKQQGAWSILHTKWSQDPVVELYNISYDVNMCLTRNRVKQCSG